MTQFLVMDLTTQQKKVGELYGSIWRSLDRVHQELPYGPSAYKEMYDEIDGGIESQIKFANERGTDEEATANKRNSLNDLQNRVRKARELITTLL